MNEDGTVNSASNPAAAGYIVLLYGTGEGQTNPAGVDGQPDSSPTPTPLAQPVTAIIGGVNARVLYAGGVSGLVLVFFRSTYESRKRSQLVVPFPLW